MDFRSSSGRYARSRHLAESHPQVLIIAPAALGGDPALLRRDPEVCPSLLGAETTARPRHLPVRGCNEGQRYESPLVGGPAGMGWKCHAIAACLVEDVGHVR